MIDAILVFTTAFAVNPLPAFGPPTRTVLVALRLGVARIGALVLAFFAGRVVSYSIYVGAADAADARLGDSLLDGLRSPAGIALQLAGLALLAVLLKVDWRRVLPHHRPCAGAPS